MEANFEERCDPGLAISNFVPAEVIIFGKRATEEILYQSQVIELAAQHSIYIEGLGGTKDGVIGALAAIGLAADGNNGRYVRVGKIRTVSGMVSPGDLITAGIHKIITQEGFEVIDGYIRVEKLRPARRNGLPILYVEEINQVWNPLNLD